MPHRYTPASNANDDDAAARVQEVDGEGVSASPKKPRRSSLMRNIGNIGNLWRRQPEPRDTETSLVPQTTSVDLPPLHESGRARRSSLPGAYQHRRAIPSLPRPQTFRRQESERREKLLEVPPSPTERRAVSADRRRGFNLSRTLSPQLPIDFPSYSALNITSQDEDSKPVNADAASSNGCATNAKQSQDLPTLSPLQIPEGDDLDNEHASDADDEIDLVSLQEEFDRRWILNLSMHFRDQSRREKFFVTYAETPSKWRRLTISLDYRDVREGSGSLEADLSTMHYQRDKSFRIYEAIHESLPEIQYYNTVTNLRLETTPEDGQLHVHVREDANEIVQFPSIDLFAHVEAPRFAESEVEFLTHLSGFVYKVHAGDKVLIKKEIPGPDTIDEFLYEVNALDALQDSRHVIGLEGLVTDDSGLVVKGLLISYASEGALVDILYDHRHGSEIPWYRREKWAKQIVEGLSDIHEAGFVQGDFTLSNIVIDDNDDALIIDINRRGCPVGWEPPELSRLIESGQRISMCIGVKTDIYQLGMVLWGVAEAVDEPERVERPLPPIATTLPPYFQLLIDACLNSRPQARPTAKRLLRRFPDGAGQRAPSSARSVDFAPLAFAVDDLDYSGHSQSTAHRSDKEYIDPRMAITLDDVSHRHHHHHHHQHRRPRSPPRDVESLISEHVTYFSPSREELTDAASNPASTNAQALSNPTSTSYRWESSGSWEHLGRQPRAREYSYGGIRVGRGRRRSSPFARSVSPNSSATSVSGAGNRSPPSRSRRRAGSDVSEDERKSLKQRECCDEVVKADVGDAKDDSTETADQPVTLEATDVPLQHVTDALWDFTLVEEGSPQQRFVHADSGFDEELVDAQVSDDTIAPVPQVEEACTARPVHTPATPPDHVAPQCEEAVAGHVTGLSPIAPETLPAETLPSVAPPKPDTIVASQEQATHAPDLHNHSVRETVTSPAPAKIPVPITHDEPDPSLPALNDPSEQLSLPEEEHPTSTSITRIDEAVS